MKKKIRYLLWRILGFDYDVLLNKTDFTLLRDDKFTVKGKKTYDNGAKVWRWTEAPLIIGKYCSIANNVNFIMDAGHHTISPISNYPIVNRINTNNTVIFNKLKDEIINNNFQKEGITIGNDVWIGMGAYIMPGVKIGNGVTIATNAVVTKDVKDYHMVAGVPAQVIKIKHQTSTIEKLNKIKWWDWHDDKIINCLEDFYGTMENFIKKHDVK